MSSPSLIYPKPPKSDYGIGLIGPGGIANSAHLPAYRTAELNVVAVCGRTLEAAEETAGRWDIPFATDDYRGLLERPDVHIVDIAMNDAGRVELVQAAAEAGKHILIQKPFAHRLEDAEAMVQAAEKHGVKLAVNHNARYAPFYRTVKTVLDSGALGELYLMSLEMRINQDRHMAGTHFSRMKHFLHIDYDIHHLDLMRFWSDRMPERVYCTTARMAGQQFEADMTSISLLEFGGGLRGTVLSVDSSQADEPTYRFSVEGSGGSLYGHARAGYRMAELRYRSNAEPDRWIAPVLRGDWFNDAFYGVMFELMSAIQENREPSISGKDNLGTLRVLAGIVKSVETGEVVRLNDAR